MDEHAYSTKTCKLCHALKPLSDYYAAVKSKDGRHSACKPCFKTLPYRQKEARQAERAARAARQGRTYTAGGPKGPRRKYDIHVKAWRSHIKRIERGERMKADRATKPWKAEGLSVAERFRIRYRLDPTFNLRQRVRASLKRKRGVANVDTLLRTAVVRKGNSPKMQQLFGYTASDLRGHLERQFTKGMTWAAFCDGRIHIDHIIPLASFDLSQTDELKAAWSLSNLRPLWAKDNRAKRDRRDLLL